MRLFEQGEPEAGREFLSAWLKTHEQASFLHGHLCWHVALTAIEAGDPDAALAIYQRQIRPAGSPYPPLNVLTDTAPRCCGGCRWPARRGWSRIGAK